MSSEKLTIEQIRRRFLQLNQSRIEKTEELMATRNKSLLRIIPLLFHSNNRSLAGYVDDKTPAGINAYTPEDYVVQEAKRHWRGFEFRRQAQWSIDIEAIFLMGSCGTVAYNRKSDFDVWLCYRQGLERDQLKRLQKKARLIEKWYDEVDLEVHFFLMSAEGFKKGRVSKLSSESSGTAQHHILLDEFYRTSIWLAGKTPFWWYVPPDKDAVYEKLRLKYEKNEVITSSEYIDFGGLSDIPTGEFFGAAVWQIYKGIDSPYKSVLKITLMEAYASGYSKSQGGSQLLAADFKAKVYSDERDAEKLDPYILMMDRIETYLKTSNKSNRLEVVRRSFYLKLNIKMSDARLPGNWRTKSIHALISAWGWDKKQIIHLDEKNNWKLEDVVVERKMLVLNLTESYAFLSNFARKNAKKRLINQKDLSILGRKLYAVFDRKPGKIEVFNRGIVDDLTEPSITIMLLYGKNKQEHWRLYRGKVVGDQFKNLTPLKSSSSLIEIVVWVHFNQLFSETTQKLLYAPGSDVGNAELQILMDLFSHMSAEFSLTPKSKDLLSAAYVQKSEVFLNIGKQPKTVGVGVDKQLISGELDVLNYGSDAELFVQTLEYFYVTSWKEIFVYKYYGIDGLAQWICELLEVYCASASNKKIMHVVPNVHSFGSQISHVLSKRITELYEDVVKTFSCEVGVDGVYIYEAGKQFFCIKSISGKFSFKRYDTINQLMLSLSQSSPSYFSTNINRYALQSSPLPVICKMNRPGVIQFFLHKTKTNIFVYVLDEMGSLFHQKLPNDKLETVAIHFDAFFYNITERRLLMDEEISMDGFVNSVFTESLLDSENGEIDDSETVFENSSETYIVKKSKFKYEVKPVKVANQGAGGAYHIYVEGDLVDKKTVFSFFCDDIEFSSLEWGSKVFRELARHVINKRKDRKKYYLYISDLTLSASLLGNKNAHSAQTVELLKYKKRIEESLNKALVGL